MAGRSSINWVVAVAAGGLICGSAFAANSASQVVDYVQGSVPDTVPQTNPQAALGLPVGDTGTDDWGRYCGALTPFNGPFANDHMVVVYSGGHLDLRLAEPVPVRPGPTLGVFVSNTLWEMSANYDNWPEVTGGYGLADSPAAYVSPVPQALVSVRGPGGGAWIPLSASPISFENPTNYYLDTLIDKVVALPGNEVADFTKPYTGHLSDLNGKTYVEMLDLFDGSAGGNWLDLSSSGLTEVQEIRFEVPEGAGYRMVVDSVTVVPEPAGLGLIVAAALLGIRRRR